MKRFLVRLISTAMSVATILAAIPLEVVHGEEDIAMFPYTMFAASDEEGAITLNSGNTCINGNVATNGTIVSSGNMNINGTRTEHANESMLYVLKKLNYSYFNGENVETYTEDYILEDLNININNPIDVDGTIELIGNINLNSGIKAIDDVMINGEVKNSNNAVICSETGDINIETSNVSFNGLIYAPYGDIVIDSDNLNLNNVVIIGQTITIDCPNVNANYSSSMAELIGNESSSDVEFYAMGSYNADVNAIDIEWFTNYTNGNYEVLYSDDNENYTSVATVIDTTTFQYLITEDFEKRYFKISLITNYGEVIESIPIIATKNQNGYEVEFLDSDEDGLPDIYEIMIGTDVNLSDTDDDTLTDLQEIYIAGTDPTIYDSVAAGISDADADSDEDGISNIDEIAIGTDPMNNDTDDDDLSDYDETYYYYTDPTSPDSDNDNVEDGSEIKLGLDPNNPETFDVPDSEYKVAQTISTDNPVLSAINTEDSPYELSVDLTTNLNAEKNLSIVNSSYSEAIQNDAMIGASLDISISDECSPEDIVIRYNIKEGYRDNTLNLYSEFEELRGLKRLNIFKFDEDTRMLLPIDTQFDVENGTLLAEVDDLGTYCIMDMEIWLSSLDVTLSTPSTDEANLLSANIAPKSRLSKSSSSWSPSYANAPIDLVFILQTAGRYSSYFNTERLLISSFTQTIFNNYDDVRVYIIGYNRTDADFCMPAYLQNDNIQYMTNQSEVVSALSEITYSSESERCNRSLAFQKLFDNVTLRSDADRFVYSMINGWTTTHSNYDPMALMDRDIGAYSEIIYSSSYYKDNDYEFRLQSRIASRGDLFITLSDETYSTMLEHLEGKLSPARAAYEILLPTNWKTVLLDGELSPDNNVDTDKDTLTDWEEVDTERLIWNEDGSFDIPVFDLNELINHLNRFPESDYTFLIDEERNSARRHYLPILSDPTKEDSDGDDVDDSLDANPIKRFDDRYMIVDSLLFIPEVAFTEEHYKLSLNCYDSLPNIPKLYETNDDMAFLAISALLAKNTDIPGFLFSCLYHNEGISVLYTTGKMKHASEALSHYLANTGESLVFNSTEMYQLISSSKMNIVHLINNLNRSMDCAESILIDGCNVCVSTTKDAGFKVCCFDNKNGEEFPNGTCDIKDDELQHGFGKYYNAEHMDWQNTVGEAYGGIVCNISRDGNHFTMNYCYHLSDVYEWAEHDDHTALSSSMHRLHEQGQAKEYLMNGSIYGAVEWDMGERFGFDAEEYILSNLQKD